ncbi:hypothetical protein [Bilophila wadsworthia]|uniref:hypothetical protein n=1 Tax=Bilophila wadsworthia TaxID=35833 RepID=UPI003D6F2171
MGVCRFLKKTKYICISAGLARKCEFGKALFSESKTVSRKAVSRNSTKRKAANRDSINIKVLGDGGVGFGEGEEEALLQKGSSSPSPIFSPYGSIASGTR